MAAKPTRQEITKDVYLYTTRVDEPSTSFTYELECAKFKVLDFTVDFTGSDNMELAIGGLVQRTEINPYERVQVALIATVDTTAGWSLKTSFSLKQREPDADQIREVIIKDQTEIQGLLAVANANDYGADSATAAQLREKCQENGCHFVDVEFPPNNAAVYANPESPDGGGLLHTWRRPADFLEGDFQVFEGAIEPADIRQGSLGDCWFMCALASIAEFPCLVERIFDIPKDGMTASNPEGVYRLKFCKNGEWTVVTIDDFFPCGPEAGPVFSKSNGNELWVLLIEKAFAKLHGNYYALRGGWAYEGMMDLTGAPTTTIRLDAEETKAGIADGSLFAQLRAFDDEGYLMSCSTPGEDKWTESGGPTASGGLVPGHAYTLLEVKQTAGGIQLLNIRNPWGSFEWDGAWSDDAPEWTEEVKNDPCFGPGGVSIVEGDGAFWMCFADFVTHFTSVNVCRVRGHQEGSEDWVERRLKGYFRYDSSSGEVSAPMYILDVPKECTLFVSIHQEDARVASAKEYIDMGVSLMCLGEDDQYELVTGSSVGIARETQVEATVPPGRYVVVPTTTGCKFAYETAQIDTTAAPVSLVNEEGAFTPAAEAAIHELFRRLNEQMDGVLDRDELNTFQRMAEGIDLEDEVYDWLIQNFDSVDGGLTPDGLVQAYQYMLSASDGDQEIVFKDLRFMGYDNQLNMSGARTFVLAVHADSESNIALTKVGFDAEAYEEGMELPIKRFGSVKDIAGGRARMYTRKAGYWGISFAVENLSEKTLDFTMDCAKSKNVVSHTGHLRHTAVVPPGETKVVHHLMPAKQAGWSWGYTTSSRFH